MILVNPIMIHLVDQYGQTTHQMTIIVLFKINGTKIDLGLNIPLRAIVYFVIIVVILAIKQYI